MAEPAESSASHPSIWWLRSSVSSLTVSSSHTASNLEQTLWAPPSRRPHESDGCSPCIHPGLSCIVSHPVIATASSSPAHLQKRVTTVCASVTLMRLWPTLPSRTSPPLSPLSPLVQLPWFLVAPGVHQQPPAPGPRRSCCLGCVPRTSAGHTPQPLTPWFRSHLPPQDRPSPPLTSPPLFSMNQSDLWAPASPGGVGMGVGTVRRGS